MIYLRASVEVYEAARAQMDAARGLPSKGQVTSFPPATQAVKDAQGRCLLGLRESDLTAPGADGMLADLLASGAVTQIDEATYRAALPLPVG